MSDSQAFDFEISERTFTYLSMMAVQTGQSVGEIIEQAVVEFVSERIVNEQPRNRSELS